MIVLIGTKPDPMLPKNSIFIWKLEHVPAGSTTFTSTFVDGGAPGGGNANVADPAVIVATIRTCTPESVLPVSGFVHVGGGEGGMSHCICVAEATV